MPRPRKYPDELRERAVRLVFESGRPIAQVAQDLGIHREALRLWVRQAEADIGCPRAALDRDDEHRVADAALEVDGEAGQPLLLWCSRSGPGVRR
jgi:transposase